MQLNPGYIVAGDYEIKKQLGAGGQSVTYEAHQISKNRRCALKLLHLRSSDEAVKKQVLGEAGILLELGHHPNIVEIWNVNLEPPYIVMECLDGESIKEHLKRGPMSASEVCTMVSHVAAGLFRAHEIGFIHRDLKPANVIYTPSRDAFVLIDWGIAKDTADTDVSEQQQGTWLFMAPEQVDPLGPLGPPDTATDIWALGLLVWNALTGSIYWRDPNPGRVLADLRSGEPLPKPRARIEEVLAQGAFKAWDAATLDELAGWLKTCIERDPALRCPSPLAAATSLCAILKQVPRPSLTAPSPEARAAERVSGTAKVVARVPVVTSEVSQGRLQALRQLAFERGRAGDLSLLALRGTPRDAEALLDAAGKLRDLLAFAGVVEVCDWLLALDLPRDKRVLGLELSGLALGRMGADTEARLRLMEAESLGRGESAALRARLAKQRWVAQWKLAKADPEQLQQRATAATSELIDAIDAYIDAHDKEGKYYTALNGVTLLELARVLPELRDPRYTKERIEATVARLRPLVMDALTPDLSRDRDAENRYWALVSRAELALTRPEPNHANWRAVEDDLFEAKRLARGHVFWLDATLQQLEVISKLCPNNQFAARARDQVEDAISQRERPDAERSRIVFALDGANDESLVPDVLVATLCAVLLALRERHGDAIAYVGGNGKLDLWIARACDEAGVPFVLHLPFGQDRFYREVLGGAAVDEARWRALLQSARAVVDLAQALGDVLGAPSLAGVREWTLACAAAYGMSGAILVMCSGAPSSAPSADDLAERVRSGAGTVVDVRSQAVSTRPRETDEATLPLDLPPVPASLTVPSGTGLPNWVRELGALYEDTGGESAERWRRWQGMQGVADVLRSLDLRFEPAEVLRPRMPQSVLVGFEVLGTDADGRKYFALKEHATRQGLVDIDLDLAILALGLQTIRRLRHLLTTRIDRRLSLLWFTLNINDAMLASPVFDRIIDTYFESALADNIQFELSERFPEGLATAKGGDRIALLGDAIARVERLIHGRKMAVVLDDSDALATEVRIRLGPSAVKAKADAAFVRNALAVRLTQGWGDSTKELRQLMRELGKYRIVGRPYVLEGVENEDCRELLIEHWPKERGNVWIQGWTIKVPETLREVFEPVNDAAQPQGYRIREWYRSRVSLA